MAIMEANPDSDVMRVWTLLNELSEQLSLNRNASISLHTVTGGVKTQAIHSQTGFVLRRFNQDKSQEEYNAELERMNIQMSAENLALQNDNKQLNALIKEYEQTLENLMTTFRNRANEVQQRELSIMREYERKILLRDTEELSKQLDRDTAFSASLGHVGRLLRSLMRILGGEDAASLPPPSSALATPLGSGPTSSLEILYPRQEIINSLELGPEIETETEADGETNEDTVDEHAQLQGDSTDDRLGARAAERVQAEDREAQLAAAEWALERECELARLELENRLLRQLVAEHEGALTAASSSVAPKELPTLARLPARTRTGKLGGKDVGPFGMYKNSIGAPLVPPSPQEPSVYRQG